MQRKWLALSALICVFAFAIWPENVTVHFDIRLPVSRHNFFLYYTDPNNFRHFNPTIMNLTLTKYVADAVLQMEYTEHLVQLPFLTNYMRSTYDLRRGKDSDTFWHIESSHITCFYTQPFCMSTTGQHDIKDEPKSKSSHLYETFRFSCPRMLRSFSEREVRAQRLIIYQLLSQHFRQENYEKERKKRLSTTG